MKKILMFLLLGLISAGVSAAGLMLFLNDNNVNNFHKQCLEASLSSPFYQVMQELSIDEELDFDKAYTEARKTKCESLFKQAKTLKKIKLTGLELRSIDFLKYFPNVEKVDISHNRLTSWPSELLLPNLRELNISHNKIYGTKAITRNTKIRKIDISHNPLKRIGSLKKLSNLTYINLQGTKIKNYDDIEEFKHLKTVILDNKYYKMAKLPKHLQFQ